MYINQKIKAHHLQTTYRTKKELEISQPLYPF